MAKTTSRYTVGNIVAVIAFMLFAVAMALHAFFGDHSPRLEGRAEGRGVLLLGFAVVLGWTAIKAIRSRRR